MKKLVSIIMAVLLLTSLTACGNNSQAGKEGKQNITEGQKESAESTSPAEPEAAQEEMTQADKETATEEPFSETAAAVPP